MATRVPPVEALPVELALQRSVPLAGLVARLRRSEEMYDAVRDLLPQGLVTGVRPGPVDDAGWSLLCDNASIAAKLRQLVPRLERRLHDRGHAASVRIKVLPR